MSEKHWSFLLYVSIAVSCWGFAEHSPSLELIYKELLIEGAIRAPVEGGGIKSKNPWFVWLDEREDLIIKSSKTLLNPSVRCYIYIYIYIKREWDWEKVWRVWHRYNNQSRKRITLISNLLNSAQKLTVLHPAFSHADSLGIYIYI